MSNDPLRFSIACDRALLQVALKSKQRDLIGGVIAAIGRRCKAPPRIIARSGMQAPDTSSNCKDRQS